MEKLLKTLKDPNILYGDKISAWRGVAAPAEAIRFAVLCAESMLHAYEDATDDSTLRDAIETAKRYPNVIREDIMDALHRCKSVADELDNDEGVGQQIYTVNAVISALISVVEVLNENHYSVIRRAVEATIHTLDAADSIKEQKKININILISVYQSKMKVTIERGRFKYEKAAR